MKSRSPLLIVCLALALAGSGLAGWLHPAAAAQADADICSAGGVRTAGAGTGTPASMASHDCAYCGAAPATGTVALSAAIGTSTLFWDAPVQRPARRAAHRDRLNAEPRAPPATL